MNVPRKIAIGFQEGTCPLKCPKCHGFGKNAKGIKKTMKMSLIKAIELLDEISLIDPKPVIQPHIFTEPFANSDIKPIIKKCSEKCLPMSIITNGILLDKEMMDFMINSMNRSSNISFSLDAVTQKVYEGVRGKFELNSIEEKIRYLIENRGDKGPRIGVNFSTEHVNVGEKEIFFEKWKDYVDAIRINVSYDENKKIPKEFRVEDKDPIVSCHHLDEVMVIDTEGEIRSCQWDAFGDTNLGNAFEEGVLKGWFNDKRQCLIKAQKEQSLNENDFCFECEANSIANYKKTIKDGHIVMETNYSFFYNK